jgi:hypothetical protein
MSNTLQQSQWRARQQAHEQRIDAWTTPHLDRRRRGLAHPVEDFLFTYYSYRPAALRRWHPGVGVTITGDVSGFARYQGYVVEGDSAYVDPALISARADRISWIRDLLIATGSRPAHVGCFGLHEWAMVYRERPDDVRHSRYPLRLGSSGTDDVVESHRIACTHFDAFRFFTDEARPRNQLQPTRDQQISNEQPGCLHASMDVYKWAYKLAPLPPSELVADCFELARDVRRVDMQAAPYDLSDLGVEPIKIETVDGKQQYIDAQRQFSERANALRTRLIDICTAAALSCQSLGTLGESARL